MDTMAASAYIPVNRLTFMRAESIVRSLLEDDDESPQEAYDRIKASIIANAYASFSLREKVNHWIRLGRFPTALEEPDANTRWRIHTNWRAEASIPDAAQAIANYYRDEMADRYRPQQ